MSDQDDDAPEEPALYRAFLLKSIEQLGDRIDRLETLAYEQGKGLDALASAHEAAPKATDNRRKHLLARMAGNIAGGLASNAYYVEGVIARADHSTVADDAVYIAERILRRIGL